MYKTYVLIIVFVLSIIVMLFTLKKITNNKSLNKQTKLIYTYLTILIPFLGYFLVKKLD